MSPISEAKIKNENPERIETMLFLMSLCLLVYNLGQRELRNSLKRAKIGIKNQLGKLTHRPTLRWVFQCFQAKVLNVKKNPIKTAPNMLNFGRKIKVYLFDGDYTAVCIVKEYSIGSI